jgi:hypothetical protein
VVALYVVVVDLGIDHGGFDPFMPQHPAHILHRHPRLERDGGRRVAEDVRRHPLARQAEGAVCSSSMMAFSRMGYYT